MILATLLVSPLFTDHMVLQRDRANPVWGKDTPGQQVTLEVRSQDCGKSVAKPVSVTTAADGTWRLECPVLPAGGPYCLHLKGSSAQHVSDVLVGEVWLASGQSNMEWKLPMTEDGDKAVAESADTQLRMFTVKQAASFKPKGALELEGSWAAATPQSTPGFSAVGYHFARELRKALGVPVGILHSSWGGTPVEAWTSVPALRPVYPVDAKLAEIESQKKDLPGITAEFNARMAAWEKANFPQDAVNEGEAAGWHKPGAAPQGWRPMAVPGWFQTGGDKWNGCAWYRREVKLPAAWKGRDLVLELGAIDDFDTTYVNGARVGGLPQGTVGAYQTPRRYTVPAALVADGTATIAVRVFDQFGEGGFAGPSTSLRIRPLDTEDSVALAGEWLFREERRVPAVPMDVYATAPSQPALLSPQYSPSTLFNAMISPLAGYGLRGAIWYQGESNVGEADKYRARLGAMVRDWRARWGQGDFTFLQVQLANFKAGPGWPVLREAQAQMRSEAATDMAVAIDIGNPDDIHPRNKREVGRRLALLARANTYGEAVEARGPSLERVEIAGKVARVHLAHARGLRVRPGREAVLGFELAGVDGIYKPAAARIEGATVVLESAEVPAPATVRYGWHSSPDCTLENAAGLPAEPFRTDCKAE